MDELSRKFRSIDWKGIQRSARKMQASTASALKDMVMTDLENKVRAATSDTSWGASGSDLMQIAQGTFNREDYALIMSIVWQRLGSSRWRCVFKALEVLKFLIMHGAARCIEEARAASHHIQTLQHFRHVDPKTRRDHGEGVRTRARLVCDMLNDYNVLEEEREKSKELRAKLQGGMGMGSDGRLGGLSSEDYQYNYGASSTASSSRVTTTSTGNAGNFKGYGEDEDTGTSGAYDEVPRGMFARGIGGETGRGNTDGAGENVEDLLGDAVVESSNRTSGFEGEDDEEFDPRGTGGASGSGSAKETGGVDELFGSLGLGGEEMGSAGTGVGIGAGVGEMGNGGSVPRSVMIQKLAQQQLQTDEGQGLGQGQGQGQGQLVVAGGVNGGGFEGGMGSGGMGDAGRNAVVGPKVMIRSKGDTDPFADLMDSAKKTGVL